jgi:nicotinamidase-related amidase
MTYPDFYEPDRVGQLYRARTEEAISAGLATEMRPSREDHVSRLLLLVDEQVDFVHADGSLSVPGAVEDARRVIEWIFRYAPKITDIALSLDSHHPIQIFYQTWWEDEAGRAPEPNTVITAQDVESGKWQPRFEPEWSAEYVQNLKAQAKKDLMIWPYHTMLGTNGHSLTPALYEAVAYHSAARETKPEFIIKGTISDTEYYSLLEPEVKREDDPRGTLNEDFLGRLVGYGQVYIAGQAKSHCVLETLSSIMDRYGDQREVAEKLHVLIDCTSAVAHPEIDFDAMADETLAEFEEKGLKLVSSEDPIE